MSETPDKKNDLVFLGINFHNFFQNCCIARKIEEKALSAAGEEDQHNLLKTEFPQNNPQIPNKATAEPDGDGHSVASSTDWTDLEDIILPNTFPSKNKMEEENPIFTGTPTDDYLTQEPIDFDYLREITGLDQEEDEKSATSGLSHNSKKIVKEHVSRRNARTKPSSPQQDPGLKGKRRAWQPYEDAKVLELVGKYGQSWAVIASMMSGRSGKQIRDRYLNKLKPNIKKGEWAIEEDQILLSCYYQLGHKWSKIATYLPGRTEGQVKNRFYSHLKKRIPIDDDQPQRFIQGNIPMVSPGTEKLMGIGALPEILRPGGQMILSPDPSMERENYDRQGDSPSPSGVTITTDSSKIHTEKDVDDILDKVAGYIEKKPEIKINTDSIIDLEKMSLEEKLAAVGNKENMSSNVDRLNQIEILQNRRKKLEFLLAQTLKDMEIINPQPNNHTNNNVGNGQILGEKILNM